MPNPSTTKLDFQKYHDWITLGRSYSDIRKDLATKGFSEEEISRLIRVIDHEHHSKLHQKDSNGKALGLMALGTVLFLAGAGITTYTYLMGLSGYILYYGAIFSGIGLFFSGWAKRG